ncbi:DUF1671-domain-containing protein [Sistotremastrum niveocremeum HHB9708]|uniref:DUF1671-domain-containing protein n=1 Tax=Sistotremastrum niveocremeum HHB9708 TaxID=1314777 RepID=A0A165AKN4_9AGAM|nr:DUF1671-domain-containing protein [Sistotremastrum niveocremeum HHB9708]
MGSIPARENAFWYAGLHEDPLPNYTPGLIPILKSSLLKLHAKGQTRRAALCHDNVVHVATELWDMGWGCGYRNFLMACIPLLDQSDQPGYAPLLLQTRPPGVRNLQHWIEDAWKDGFDAEGASQLKNRLTGTKKWIGTAELYVALTSKRIPASLVDFPKSDKGAKLLTDWVVKYFTPKDSSGEAKSVNDALRFEPVISSKRPPLVLQHAGHSRTIVGYELSKSGDFNLLLFDPSRRPDRALRRAALDQSVGSTSKGTSTQTSLFERVLHPNRSKRRRESDHAEPESHAAIQKRIRGGEDSMNSRASEKDDTIDPLKVVKFFRVSPTKLGKHHMYQILWFPMTEPLSDAERNSCKVVTCDRIV